MLIAPRCKNFSIISDMEFFPQYLRDWWTDPHLGSLQWKTQLGRGWYALTLPCDYSIWLTLLCVFSVTGKMKTKTVYTWWHLATGPLIIVIYMGRIVGSVRSHRSAERTLLSLSPGLSKYILICGLTNKSPTSFQKRKSPWNTRPLVSLSFLAYTFTFCWELKKW
jgi:hypothetical protein